MSSPSESAATAFAPAAAQVGPLQRQVIAAWHEAEARVDDWESALREVAVPALSGWAELTAHLQLINAFQWHEEDRSRDHGADDRILAAVKRSIDASNRRRVQTVDRLDDHLFAGLRNAGVLNPDAPLNSESPGSIIDRLSVLALKIYHIEEAVAGPARGDDAMQGRLENLQEQNSDLGGCLDRLMVGILDGRIGLRLYRQVKVYKQAGSGELTPDLD